MGYSEFFVPPCLCGSPPIMRRGQKGAARRLELRPNTPRLESCVSCRITQGARGRISLYRRLEILAVQEMALAARSITLPALPALPAHASFPRFALRLLLHASDHCAVVESTTLRFGAPRSAGVPPAPFDEPEIARALHFGTDLPDPRATPVFGPYESHGSWSVCLQHHFR